MIQRFYLDTSVFGGVFDSEFEEETLILFEKVKLVNVYRIRGYSSVNLRLGYSTLEIRSPKEIVSNEDER